MSDVQGPRAPKRKHSLYARLRVRRWIRVIVAFCLGALGLLLAIIGQSSILAVPAAALLAFAIVVSLSEGSGRSILTRRPGRAKERPTPDALLWLWCFAGLIAALLAWKAMALGATWLEAEARRETNLVVTTSVSGSRITAVNQPAP